MKRHARNAFDALQKIGAPVTNHCQHGESLSNQWGAHFIISAELRDSNDSLFADYYGEEIIEGYDESGEIVNAFGILESVNVILRDNGLFAEFIDPGTVGVYDA